MFSNYPVTKKRKVEKFMEPTGTFKYYEDLYGRRNREEDVEGSVHSCKSDSDEENSRKPSDRPPPDRFFRKYTTPKNKSTGSNHFGTIRKPAKQTTSSSFPPSATACNIEGSPSKPRGRFSSKQTKLKPGKYGVFGASATDMGEPNSAGEFMDDMLGPGDRAGADYFKTLEPDTASEGEEGLRKDTPMSEPKDHLLHSQVDKPAALGADDIYNESLEIGENAGIRSASIRSASDGDIEDNDSELNEELKKEVRSLRSRQPRARAKKPAMATKTFQPAKPKYSLRKDTLKCAAATSSDAGTPRRSARHLKAENVQSANRGVGTLSSDQGKQLAASNRSKMTARAMTLRKKTKEAGSSAPENEYYQAVYGRKSKGKKQQTDTTADEKDEYYRAVYGRKAKAQAEDVLGQYEYEPEYTDIVPSAVAKVMGKMGGRVETEVAEVEDVDEYKRMF